MVVAIICQSIFGDISACSKFRTLVLAVVVVVNFEP